MAAYELLGASISRRRRSPTTAPSSFKDRLEGTMRLRIASAAMRAMKRRPMLAAGTLLVASGAAYVSIVEPTGTVAGLVHGFGRSSFAVYTFAVNSMDYKLSLRDYDKKTEEYYEILAQVHLRAAKRILRLCDANRGFYTKAGQFIASLQQFPKEYCNTLKVLQDQAQYWPFKAIERVFLEEFGKSPLDIFEGFDSKPLAAASLAQVHHAVLKTGEEVAVKVQYPGLQRQLEIDIATMAFLSRCVAWLFPDYQFGWLVPEFEKNLLRELDFIQEAKNAERTTSNLAHKKEVRIPTIQWSYTTKRVITMQFMHGSKIDDADTMLRNGIDPKEVAQVLLETFAEMIFCHGFVHGDPHPGNILVQRNPTTNSRRNFYLVILDHGLYRELDDGFRLNFCRLWKSMILLDSAGMQQAGQELGAGEYHRYLPVILIGRSWNSKSGLGMGMSQEERNRIKEEVRKFTMGDISLFMEGISRDFLVVLRTDGLLRTIVSKLGAPPRQRMETYARFSVLGHTMYKGQEQQGGITYLKALVAYAYLRFRLEALELYLRAEVIYRTLVSLTLARIMSAVSWIFGGSQPPGLLT